jgi:ribosome biogenesis GTPase
MQGIVLKYFSNFFYVRVESASTATSSPQSVVLACMVKSLLKKQGIHVLVGDTVTLDEINHHNQTARIVSVQPRTTLLKKPKIANVHRVLVFVPLHQPNLDLRQLDRLLAHVTLSGLTPWIIFTKADLLTAQPLPWEALGFTGIEALVACYQQILNVPVIATSVLPHSPYYQGVEKLATLLQGTAGNYVLAGVSGAGKSSLLNELNPQFKLKTGAVSDKLERGTHTTRHTELLELFPSVWLADAPGFSHLAFEGIEPEQLQQGFLEFSIVTQQSPCEYPTCLHHAEPNCAVKAAVSSGDIHPSRHLHYTELLADVTEAHEIVRKQSHKQEIGGTKQGNRKHGGQQATVVRLDPKLRDANRKQYNQQLNQLHQTLEDALSDATELLEETEECFSP